jgi:hypothetical protein
MRIPHSAIALRLNGTAESGPKSMVNDIID